MHSDGGVRAWRFPGDVHVIEQGHRIEVSLAAYDLVLAVQVTWPKCEETFHVFPIEFRDTRDLDVPDSRSRTRDRFQDDIGAQRVGTRDRSFHQRGCFWISTVTELALDPLP